MSLRRGSSVLIGGAFERLFCPEGREFEEANLQKFKFPGVARGGGMLNFRIDRRITFSILDLYIPSEISLHLKISTISKPSSVGHSSLSEKSGSLFFDGKSCEIVC